jgi:IS1 transposase
MAVRFAALPAHLHALPVAAPREMIIGRLEVEADAMWSFVAKKANKQWVWSTMDTQTRQIIAFHVGDRSHNSVQHTAIQSVTTKSSMQAGPAPACKQPVGGLAVGIGWNVAKEDHTSVG